MRNKRAHVTTGHQRLWWILLLLVFLILTAGCVPPPVPLDEQGVLETEGLTETWIFNQSRVSLSVVVEERTDGLVDWSRNVKCPIGEVKISGFGVGYSKEDFDQRFRITDAKILTSGEIDYTTGDGNNYRLAPFC